MSRSSRNRSTSRERRGSDAQRLKLDSQSLESSSTEIIVPESDQSRVSRYQRNAAKGGHAQNRDDLDESIKLLSKKKNNRDLQSIASFPVTNPASRESINSDDKGPQFYKTIPGGHLAGLLKKVPDSSYNEVPRMNNMIHQKASWMDIFLTDFFFIRPETEKYCLMYIYVPSMSDQLARKVQEIQKYQYANGNTPAFLTLAAQTEDMFVRENHGIDEGNKDEIIRVAFRMDEGRLDDHCRRFLSEFPIMQLATNTNWPVVRIMFLQSCPLRAVPFLKKGSLSKTEWKLLNSGTLLAIASSLLFLDRGEIGRVISLAGEHFGEVSFDTIKYLSDSNPSQEYYSDDFKNSFPSTNHRPSDITMNGRVTLRFALNQTTVPRRMLYRCQEITKLMEEAKIRKDKEDKESEKAVDPEL